MIKNINGIDVSKCEFYNNYECDAYKHEYWEAEDNTRDMCKWHENCYFKQLQQAKVEIYQLHNDLKECGFKREQYKQVFEEIREIISEKEKIQGAIISQSEFNMIQLDLSTKKLVKILDKLNEVLNDRD